jgi:hypothetical protein
LYTPALLDARELSSTGRIAAARTIQVEEACEVATVPEDTYVTEVLTKPRADRV